MIFSDEARERASRIKLMAFDVDGVFTDNSLYYTDEGVEIKVLPGVSELFDGKVSIRDVRDINIADLLGRSTIETDIESIVHFLNGKRVLVLCQGGGTSGLLANALAKAAKERGIDLETAAEAYGNHVDMLPDFDLVVLAPQAASYLADLQKDCERVGNKCVACRGKQYIELSQNGDKSLAFVSEQL